MEDPEGMAQFVGAGNLILCTTGYDGVTVMALWDEIGIPYEWYDSVQLQERFPGLDIGRYYPPKRIDDPAFAEEATGELTAIYNADSGYIDDPMLAAHNLAHAARHHGAEFRFRQAVVEIGRQGGHVTGVVLESGEQISAPVVVNVGGPHSSVINRMAGVEQDMRIRNRALRQEVFAVPAPKGFALDEGGPVVADLDIGQYFRPQAGGTLLVGGTEPECDVLEWIDDPDHFNEYTTIEHWETYMLRLARRLPEFGVPNEARGLAALYDASDDWVPIYDRSSLDGFYMACGTSGNQFKNAPLAGQFPGPRRCRRRRHRPRSGARPVHRTADRPDDQPRGVLPTALAVDHVRHRDGLRLGGGSGEGGLTFSNRHLARSFATVGRNAPRKRNETHRAQIGRVASAPRHMPTSRAASPTRDSSECAA